MIRTFALAAALGLIVAGCSDPKKPEGSGGAGRADEMREVGGLIAAHTAKGRKAAPTAAELSGYEAAFPLGVKLVRSGEVVALWRAQPVGEGDIAAGKGGTDVIAYEKQAETAGGWVVLQNGNPKQMTPDEFKAAPKAK